MDSREAWALAKDIGKRVAPDNRDVLSGFAKVKDYRGKPQHVVGYSWARRYSGRGGAVYDVVLGAGESYEQAMKRALDRAGWPDACRYCGCGLEDASIHHPDVCAPCVRREFPDERH